MVIPKKKEDTPKDFKAVLWASADKLRAQMDAAEYKHLVLGMIFLKYISDIKPVWPQEKQETLIAFVDSLHLHTLDIGDGLIT